jgi:ABC-type sugar transport system permease subunit
MTSMTSTSKGVPAVLSAKKLDSAGPGKGRRAKLTPWLFLIVPLGLLILFTYIPAVNMLYYSFTSWDGTDPVKTFIGAKNYFTIFTKPEIIQVFLVSIYYFVASFFQMAIALYFATILSFSTRFRNLFKGFLFFPYLINGVAVAFVFLYFFQPGGTLDGVLQLFGVHNPPFWLGNQNIINYSLAGTSVWRFTGLNFVLFLGAIQSIPREIYEAAEIDGANRWHEFRYIIAPGIKRIISLSFILAISGSLAVFEIPFIMTGGANGSATFVIYAVREGFGVFHKVGLASALAVVLLLLVLLVTWIQRLLVPDEKVDLA